MYTKMENVLNNEEVIKCGEILLLEKQNKFALHCVECKRIFSQLVVYARHVRSRHLLDSTVILEKKEQLNDLSVYTVEELLMTDDDTGFSEECNEEETNGDVSSPISNSDDTGIDTDEELEKQILELLASAAGNSRNEAEFSDDSGVGSKNITDQESRAFPSMNAGGKTVKEDGTNNVIYSGSQNGTTSVCKITNKKTPDKTRNEESQILITKEKPNLSADLAKTAIMQDEAMNTFEVLVSSGRDTDISIADAENKTCPPFVASEQIDEPFFIIGGDDELEGAKFSIEEIDQIKANISDVSTSSLKKLENNKLQNPRSLGLSGNQVECGICCETNQQPQLQEIDSSYDELLCPKETDVAGPLDLSLNKSGDLAGDLFGQPPNEDEDILREVENSLARPQTTAFADDQFRLEVEWNELLTSDGMDNRQLPSFSRFFKNSANAMSTSNGLFAQSTPKQRSIDISNKMEQTKKASPLGPSAQLNTDKGNCTENLQNIKCSREVNGFQKCSTVKRVLHQDEKENELKKRKAACEDIKKRTKTDPCDKKQGLEILNVEVLPPHKTVLENLKFEAPQTSRSPNIRQIAYNKAKMEAHLIENVEKELIPYVKINKPNFLSPVATDGSSEKCITSVSDLNYTPEDTLNQIKLEQLGEEMLTSFNFEGTDSFKTSLLEENSFANESMLSNVSEEQKENYQLLLPLGLQIIVDPDVEEGMKLSALEVMRAKANLFANIFVEFKYLWKVGNGIKSFEELEMNFCKLMQRTNEQFKLELTIEEMKHIINLISLWYMQSYQKWLIKKKALVGSVHHYLYLFIYLPKTARRVFYCEECPRYFLTQQKYIAHRSKHMALPFTCPYCQTTYASRKQLLIHTKICITFNCVECECQYENAADLEYHLRSEHLCYCEQCGKLCATSSELEWHEHQYPIICGLCNRIFETAAGLQEHRQDSHHLDYMCSVCDVFLPTATQMKHHLRLCNVHKTSNTF